MDGTKPRRFLFTTPLLVKGGTERVVSLLSLFFERAGHHVAVVTYAGPIEYPVGGTLYQLSLGRTSGILSKLFRTVSRILRLRQIHAIENPDVMIAFLGNIAPILTGKPVYCVIQTHYERMSIFDKIALATIYRLPNVRAVIVPSVGLKHSLERHTKLRTITCIPNMVDIDAVHQSLVGADVPFTGGIVSVGRLVPVKRFDHIIRAYAASNLCQAFDLVIVGEGPERKRLEDLIAELGLSRVRLVGQTDNPYQYMAAAHVCVVGSQSETFANVIIESMACGTPVISTDCDFGPREIIRPGVDGLLVPNDDIDALMSAMEEVYKNKVLYGILTSHTTERAADFSLDTIGTQWLDFLISHEPRS